MTTTELREPTTTCQPSIRGQDKNINGIVGHMDAVTIGDATVVTKNVVIKMMQPSRTGKTVAHKEFSEHD